MNQGNSSQYQVNDYYNPLEGQLNYKNYYRIKVLFFYNFSYIGNFAILVTLGIILTHLFTQHRKDTVLTFL
ncbi:unnamed protein product [Paramecium primaurelia]|uniref:Uncharacterized protein n=1 Tax=Paramecium primaurelia TaxID=5886 RepID=A0A8S1LKE5_PARPR|nr:unnamed protein product [Paramecium primaurelia]